MTEGVKCKGNTITVECKDSKEAKWVLWRIELNLGTYRFFSGDQWTDEEVARMKKQTKGVEK